MGSQMCSCYKSDAYKTIPNPHQTVLDSAQQANKLTQKRSESSLSALKPQMGDIDGKQRNTDDLGKVLSTECNSLAFDNRINVPKNLNTNLLHVKSESKDRDSIFRSSYNSQQSRYTSIKLNDDIIINPVVVKLDGSNAIAIGSTMSNCLYNSLFYLNGSLNIVQNSQGQNVIIHQKIRKEFSLGFQNSIGLEIVESLGYKQVIVSQKDGYSTTKVDSSEEVLKFVQKNSKHYKNIKNIEKIGETITSDLYQVQSLINESLVIKVPKSSKKLKGLYDLIFETQLQSILQDKNSDNLTIVKEEIFEVHEQSSNIFNYVSILERPQTRLIDFIEGNNISVEQDENVLIQKFSQEKYIYLLFQGIKILDFLEYQGLYYGDISPIRLLISNDYHLKLGDFLLCILTDKSAQQQYYLRGINKRSNSQRLIQEYAKSATTQNGTKEFFQKQWSYQELKSEDRQCLGEAFILPDLVHKISSQEIQKFASQQIQSLREKPDILLIDIIEQFQNFFNTHHTILLELAKQFEVEGMEEAINSLSNQMIQIGIIFNNYILLGIGQVIKGEMLAAKKDYENAQIALYDAIKLQDKHGNILGDEYSARALRTLAKIGRDRGDLQQTLEYLQMAEKACKDKVQLLNYYLEFQEILTTQEKFHQAIECNQKALQIIKELKDEEHINNLECHLNLAEIYQKLDKPDKAEESFQRCIHLYDVYERRQRRENSVASSKFNKANVITKFAISMRGKQEFEKAAQLLKKVILLKIDMLKTKNNMEVAQLYNDLALAQQGLENFEDAIDSIKETILIQQKCGSGNTQEQISSYLLLSELYREIFEYDPSIEVLEEAIKTQKELDNHKNTIDLAVLYKAIAYDFIQLETFDQAINYIKTAYEIESTYFEGVSHFQVQETMLFLAEALSFNEDYQESLELINEVIKVREDEGYAIEDILPLYRMRSVNYQQTQQYDEAIENLKKIIAAQMQLEEGNEQQPIIVSLYTKVAGNYRLKGDLDNAIAYSAKVYDLMKKMFGKKHDQTNQAFKNVGVMYYENKEYAKAFSIFNKYLKIFEQIYSYEQAQGSEDFEEVIEMTKLCKQAIEESEKQKK